MSCRFERASKGRVVGEAGVGRSDLERGLGAGYGGSAKGMGVESV
jgi:hypothetical protein